MSLSFPIRNYNTMLYNFDIDVSYTGLDEDEGDDLYRKQFATVFSMESLDFNNEQWTKVFEELMEYIGKDQFWLSVFDKVGNAYSLPKTDENIQQYYEYCVVFLLSFTHFEHFHRALRDYQQGELCETSRSYLKLVESIENNHSSI